MYRKGVCSAQRCSWCTSMLFATYNKWWQIFSYVDDTGCCLLWWNLGKGVPNNYFTLNDKWLKSNLLTLNSSKTNFICFSQVIKQNRFLNMAVTQTCVPILYRTKLLIIAIVTHAHTHASTHAPTDTRTHRYTTY